MTFPERQTEQLKLVKINESHTDDLFQIFSDDRVTKYYGMDSLTEREEAKRIAESFQTGFQNKRSMRWGITLKETGQFVGTVGLNNLNLPGKKAEIGYELKPEFWGKGITSEAVRSILDFAFNELDLYRIGAVTFPENKPSYLLLEKIGFQREGLLRGYLRQGGRQHDAFVFSVLSHEYDKNIM